jgi:hypothetical protein
MLVSCPLQNASQFIWCSHMKVAPFQIFIGVLVDDCFDFFEGKLMGNCSLAVEEYTTVSYGCTKQIKADPHGKYITITDQFLHFGSHRR